MAYTPKVLTPIVCIEARCEAQIPWNGRGRPPERCETHRLARARWVKVRSARRARARERGVLPAQGRQCVEPGCTASVGDFARPRGGRTPERCPEHRAARQRAVKAHSRTRIPGSPRAPVTLLDAPVAPPRIERAQAPKPPAPRCACGRRLRGAKSLVTMRCLACRKAHERTKRDARHPRCTQCARKLRGGVSLEQRRCWTCRQEAARTSAVEEKQARGPAAGEDTRSRAVQAPAPAPEGVAKRLAKERTAPMPKLRGASNTIASHAKASAPAAPQARARAPQREKGLSARQRIERWREARALERAIKSPWIEDETNEALGW